ncbi:hypothetical protein ACO0LM_23210 [Undibacterium sp. Di26W]|uniref:hypothetical protein n=1 Tax=Undibacterium sp. Di26W TaxID=3413035 RepID=UPI003BF290EA
MHTWNHLLASTLIIAAILLSPCTGSAKDASKPVLRTNFSKESALLMAKQMAEKRGIKLTDFNDPEVFFELTKKDKSWTVFFVKKTLVVDGNIMVVINDRTGESRIVRN